jgi:hypothetical protein
MSWRINQRQSCFGCGWRYYHCTDSGQTTGNYQAVAVALDRTPGMCAQEFCEIIEQLFECEVVNAVIEIVADTPDRRGVGVDGLWAVDIPA